MRSRSLSMCLKQIIFIFKFSYSNSYKNLSYRHHQTIFTNFFLTWFFCHTDGRASIEHKHCKHCIKRAYHIASERNCDVMWVVWLAPSMAAKVQLSTLASGCDKQCCFYDGKLKGLCAPNTTTDKTTRHHDVYDFVKIALKENKWYLAHWPLNKVWWHCASLPPVLL